MAIKGKKKSQKRGSQARRRPAAPPRPTVHAKRRSAWYRSPAALLAIVLAVSVGAGLIIWGVQNARDDAAALENRQDRIDTYTGKVRGVLQTLRPPVEQMAATPPTLEGGDAGELGDELARQAARWQKDLEGVQKEFGAIAPPQDQALQRAHSLFARSIEIYMGAARGYALAAKVDGASQAEALALASQQRDHGSQIWSEATSLLDDERSGAELESSGLTAPGAPAPGAQPGAVPTGLPTELPTGLPTDGGAGGGGKGGGQPGGDGAVGDNGN